MKRNPDFPIENESHFMDFLYRQVGRDNLTENEKCSFSFLRDRIAKHSAGLNFCFYKGKDVKRNQSRYLEELGDDYLVNNEFNYGEAFSLLYNAKLTDELTGKSDGIWISHCICDFDEVPEPAILPWGFHRVDFWSFVEDQSRRANELWEHLSREIEAEYI